VSVEYRNVEGLADPPGYTHVAIGHGAHAIFTAGAVPIDAEGNLVGAGDPVAQTERVIENLLRQLETGGAGASEVVKTTVYVAADHDAMIAVWDAVQRSPIAAAPSTLLGVALLGYTGQMVEIEAIAVL
jgi:enamine deaminase RidA (YjgF/YER057c/UK114 family)